MENKFEFAKQIIREAGDLIKSSMLSNLQVEEKTRFDDLVTNVDKSTQELLVTKIKNIILMIIFLLRRTAYDIAYLMAMFGFSIQLMERLILLLKGHILLL